MQASRRVRGGDDDEERSVENDGVVGGKRASHNGKGIPPALQQAFAGLVDVGDGGEFDSAQRVEGGSLGQCNSMGAVCFPRLGREVAGEAINRAIVVDDAEVKRGRGFIARGRGERVKSKDCFLGQRVRLLDLGAAGGVGAVG